MLTARKTQPKKPLQKEGFPFSAFVHLGYGFGAEKYRSRYTAGQVPDLTPYGLHHAEKMNCKVTHSFDHGESKLAGLHRRFWNKLLGFDVIHAFRNRKQMEAADVIWTMEERQYLGVLLLGFFLPRLRTKPVIAQTVWLFDRWAETSRARRWILRKLLHRAASLTVHSSKYLERENLSSFHHQMQLLPFGISLDSFPRSADVQPGHFPIHILAMGNDPTRDWTTLLDAFGNDARFEIIAISQRLTPEILMQFANLRTLNQPRMEDFRWCYRWADFAVVPMVPNLYSGITVVLEATSMGVPVISSATGGVDTYFNPDEVLFVPSLDPNALRECALQCGDRQRKALVERAQHRFDDEDYSTVGLAKRYVELSRKLLLKRESAASGLERLTGHGNYHAKLSHRASKRI